MIFRLSANKFDESSVVPLNIKLQNVPSMQISCQNCLPLCSIHLLLASCQITLLWLMLLVFSSVHAYKLWCALGFCQHHPFHTLPPVHQLTICHFQCSFLHSSYYPWFLLKFLHRSTIFMKLKLFWSYIGTVTLKTWGSVSILSPSIRKHNHCMYQECYCSSYFIPLIYYLVGREENSLSWLVRLIFVSGEKWGFSRVLHFWVR